MGIFGSGGITYTMNVPPNVNPAVTFPTPLTVSNVRIKAQDTQPGNGIAIGYIGASFTVVQMPLDTTPPFSQPITSVFPNVQQSTTCLQGHFNPSVPKHFWFYQSKVTGSATVEVRAAAVNPAQSGNLIAKLFDGATQMGSVTIPYPASGENTGSITIPSAVAGNIYRLEVELGAPASPTQAHHYKVTSSGLTFSVGVNSPTHRYSEHFGSGEPEVYQVNVGAGENFALNIFTESPDFGAPQSASIIVELRDRSTLTTLLGPTTVTLGAAPASQLITLANPFPSSPGQLVLYISPDGHYRMDKTSGTDKAIYYDTCPQRYS